jgi:hypothetical protein
VGTLIKWENWEWARYLIGGAIQIDKNAFLDSMQCTFKTHSLRDCQQEAWIGLFTLLKLLGHHIDSRTENVHNAWACLLSAGDFHMLQFLLRLGMDATARNDEGCTVFHILVVRVLLGYIPDVPFLWDMFLDAGADIDRPNNVGVTPLMLAYKYSKKLFVRLLRIARPFKSLSGQDVTDRPEGDPVDDVFCLDADGKVVPTEAIDFPLHEDLSPFGDLEPEIEDEYGEDDDRSRQYYDFLTEAVLDDIMAKGRMWAEGVLVRQGWNRSNLFP